jgi:hypothetical protein
LRRLDGDEEAKLINRFLEQTASHYREIVENCEVGFTKEIELETHRRNFTYEKAEEIRSELEKICAWFDRVRHRDWFGAPNDADARAWLQRCEQMFEEFEAKVYDAQEERGTRNPLARAATRRRPSLTSAPRVTTITAARLTSLASN